MSTALVKQEQGNAGGIALVSDAGAYRIALDMAAKLADSSLVPDSFKGNPGSCLIALDVAARLSMSPFMVMQNLHVIGGRASWSSAFIIAALNACGRFSPLRFDIERRGRQSLTYDAWQGPKGQRQKVTKTVEADLYTCTAWAIEKATGERIDGVPVTTEMAAAEGWWGKDDSKWRTMPELMMRYRAAAFFGRLYAPDVLLGMLTDHEASDVAAQEVAEKWSDRNTAVPEAQVEAADPMRDEFNALLTDAQWTASQVARFRTRYDAGGPEERATLLANMREHLRKPAPEPQATEEAA